MPLLAVATLVILSHSGLVGQQFWRAPELMFQAVVEEVIDATRVYIRVPVHL